jgi:ribosomal protein S18 acetylase RimI-like enzyme
MESSGWGGHDACVVNEVAERAKRAWAVLAGLDNLSAFQVVVRPNSGLCPPGWIGLLGLADTITACVPTTELVGPVEAALADLSTAKATTPEVVLPRLPPVSNVMGPAALFYPSAPMPEVADGSVEEVTSDELTPLMESVSPAERDESGVADITSPAFVVRTPHGQVVAACGYRQWPSEVAHMCVLTHPDYRRNGHGVAVAAAAIVRATSEGLLPQWRARPLASRALAEKLNLLHLGTQLSLQPL